MLLVNLDFSIRVEDLKKIISENNLNVESVLDFSNGIKNKEDLVGISICYPKDYDVNFESHKRAIEVYIKNIGRISETILEDGSTIRDILFDDFPVYWLTQISIKHAQLSVVKNLFYLEELIKKGSLLDLTKKEIILCLPSKELYFDELVQSRLKEQFNINSKIYSVKNEKQLHSNWSNFSFLKNVFNNYSLVRKKCKKLKNGLKKGASDISIFTYLDSTWMRDEKHDYTFKELNEYFQEDYQVDYIPFFTSIKSITELKKWEVNWDKGLIEYFPSKLRVLSFVFGHYKFINKINTIIVSNKNNPGSFINTKIIRKELNDIAFLYYWKVFYYYWLKNYFKKGIKKQKKLFYQDEFYDAGRLISFAKNSSKNTLIKTFGVQHGLFFSGHTVYSILNNEIGGKNSMPIPDKFVVWGNVFKKEFLKKNTLHDEYVLVAGNLKYNKRFTDSASKTTKVKKKSNTILWCVTIEADTIQMFEVFKDSIDLMQNFEIIVRCHPLHDIKNTIINLFCLVGFNAYSFSTSKDIFDDIDKSVMMISSNASTTFIDGLIANIPIINIVLPDYQMDKFVINNLYNVSNTFEFKQIINYILHNKKSVLRNDFSQINSSISNWKKILTS